MEVKTFELRDTSTFVPVICIKLEPDCEQDRYLLRRAGYGTSEGEQGEYILMAGLEGGEINYDHHNWGANRTRQIAHKHIIENWYSLKSGQVIDVEFILGETTEAKTSESNGVL